MAGLSADSQHTVKNVLVIGYGSIGKRHVGNLLELKQIEQVIVWSKHLDSFQDHPEKGKLKIVRSFEELLLLLKNGDALSFGIIANETYKHIETANILAELGLHLFIEKPISHSLSDAISLRKIVLRKANHVFIAYNLRFLGALLYVKQQIRSGSIGDLCYARIEVGQYLPTWRPENDYRESYSARKDKGGGVALDLSHEIDYMRFLFEDPVSWKIIKSKASDLDIDSEDLFEGLYRFPSGFLCSVHMDYICHDKKREMNIIGSEGTIRCNLVEKYIKIQKNNGELSVIEDDHLFDIAESYRTEMNHFIECIEKDEDPQITLDDGIEVLKLLEDSHV